MPGTLETLLRRIRDGVADGGDVAEARRLVASDARLPEELREIALQEPDDLEGDAAGLLAVLGADELFGDALSEAISSEGGDTSELRRAEDPLEESADGAIEDDEGWGEWGRILAQAVRTEAGDVDAWPALELALGVVPIDVKAAVEGEGGRVELAGRVLGALGLGIGSVVEGVAEAVVAEAGRMADVSVAVGQALGSEQVPVAEAVRDEMGAADVTAAVGAEVGEVALPMAAAVVGEAGSIELAVAVMQALGIADEAPIADAVRAEAGDLDVAERIERTLAPEVLAGLLDRQLDDTTHRLAAEGVSQAGKGVELTAMADLARDLKNALEDEAGPVQLWAAVAGQIGIAEPELVAGWDGDALVAAVRAEAGGVDVVAGVQAAVARYARPLVMPLAEVPMVALPPAANAPTLMGRGYSFGGLLMVAAVLLVLGLGQFWGEPPAEPALRPVPTLTFASAGELVIEDLQYAADVQVMQMEGDGGAVILWVDEEVVL